MNWKKIGIWFSFLVLAATIATGAVYGIKKLYNKMLGGGSSDGK